MSSHKKHTKRFSRRTGPRKLLIKGLLVNLIENESMVTTKVKGKEIKRHFDKIVTLAKKNNLNSYRLVCARLSNKNAAEKLVKVILPRLTSRSSGFVSTVLMPNRAGDNSKMIYLKVF